MASSNLTSIQESFLGNETKSLGMEIEEVASLTTAESWGWAFLFVTVINLSSVMGIIFFPLMKKSFYALIMRVMIGLAIGSLSGSSLFHLIPAAFDIGGKNEKGQSYINIAVFIWLSIWIVMMLECTIKIVVKSRTLKKSKRRLLNKSKGHGHNHNHNHNHAELPLKISPTKNTGSLENGKIHDELILSSESPQLEKDIDNDGSEDEMDVDGTHSVETSQGNLPIYRSTLSLSTKNALEASLDMGETGIKTVAWIIIIGDSLHNFIDGVSIGAGFVKNFRTGSIISLAIMCEEFPHELGDFAILISSGFSVKKALFVNFLSALTCYLGMALGLVLGEIQWANYIFAFAAGIFLYVSLADMIPEITSLIDEVTDINPRRAWGVLLTHNIGIIAGICILYLLAAFQPEQ